ncbi:uncharacterized protein LOC125668729 isoform X2 [Ostrea edulis]|uniref:uncharacterized protein LOC125668729 isoform X2 n=1 Tax=Ostrea edulis TaxID=37623 RepID=UPI0024AFCB22|nr:uncharacterized protein LOC125668729 isoform X2 [Ostrea edulis]
MRLDVENVDLGTKNLNKSGSVLGPGLYAMFAKPIGEICRRHHIMYHCYADDTQAYLVFKPTDTWNAITSRLHECLADIKSWMNVNLLKLNEEKTEFIVFTLKHSNVSPSFQLSFGNTIVSNSDCVRNLGAFFDSVLSFKNHISYISRSCYYHLRNIARIRSFINDDACKTLVCSLVLSRLDYENALFKGLPQTDLSRLQRIQNSADRLVARVRKHDHISPVLVSLHWLPVNSRVEYKNLLHIQGTKRIGTGLYQRPHHCVRTKTISAFMQFTIARKTPRSYKDLWRSKV